MGDNDFETISPEIGRLKNLQIVSLWVSFVVLLAKIFKRYPASGMKLKKNSDSRDIHVAIITSQFSFLIV